MLFTKLMVATSRPMYWNVAPGSHAQALRSMFVELFDPDRPGIGYVRVGSGDTNDDWLAGGEAIECVDGLYEVWSTVPEAMIEEPSRLAAGYDELRNHFVDVFVDFQRVRSSLADPETVDELAAGEPVYLGISSDWSILRGGLLWNPQLRAWNYWPAGTWAPEPTSKVDDPLPRDGSQTAQDLERRLMPLVLGLDRLPIQHGLGQADIRVGDAQAYPAIFYSALPASVPDEPDKLLEAPCLDAIQEIARDTLGTPDILSEDVAGSYLEGRIVTLRHERALPQGLGSFYLAIPWLPSGIDFASAESALYRVTALAAELETYAVGELDDVTHRASVTDEWLSLLHATLDRARELVDEVLRFIRLTPTGRSQRDEASRLCEELRGAFLGLETRLSELSEAAHEYETKWQLTVDQSAEDARYRFAIRPLASLCAGLDKADGSAPFTLSHNVIGEATRRAADVRSKFARVESSVRAMAESEKEATRWREEGNTRLLGYGLAIVALATVFPILIGEPQWDATADRISGWEPQAQWLAQALDWSHSVLITGSIAVASIAVVAILALMVRMATQRWLTTRDPLFGYGASIKKIWDLLADPKASPAERAAADQAAGREAAAVCERLLSDDKGARTQLARLRMRVERFVVAQSDGKGTRAELAGLRTRVERFVVAQALLVDRPLARDCTPLLASVLRYQGQKLLGAAAVGDKEFVLALEQHGIAAADLGDATRFTELSPVECCSELERHPALRGWLTGAAGTADGDPTAATDGDVGGLQTLPTPSAQS